MSTVTTSSSVSPMARPSLRTFSARPPGSSRLSFSPCSSRSTIAVCSMRRRFSAPAVPVLAPSDSLRNRFSTESATAAAVVPCALRDGLDRPALGDLVQELLVGLGEPGVVGDRLHQRLDDLRVEHRAAGRHLAHRAGELVALADPVLEQVGVAGGAVTEQRDGVVGVVVLRQHDHAGAGVALAQRLGRVDALALEARRHADVGDQHLRAPAPRPRRGGCRSRRRCPTTSRSGSSASSARTPSRTITLSSARNTVIRPSPMSLHSRWSRRSRQGGQSPAPGGADPLPSGRPAPSPPPAPVARRTLARCNGLPGRTQHARRVVGHQRVVDPVGGGHGRRPEGHVRLRHHQLRRPAARRHRRPRRVAGRGPVPLRQPARRRGPRSSTARSSTPAAPAVGSWAPRPCAWPSCGPRSSRSAPRPAPRGSDAAPTPRSRSCRPPAGAPACPRRGG